MHSSLRTTLTSLSFAALLAATASSQAHLFPTKRLVGWADISTSPVVSVLDLQEIDTCKPAQTFCKYKDNDPFAASLYNYTAGGTAYDARHRTAWISDGVLLSEHQIRGCGKRCGPYKATKVNPNSWVSGLAISQRKQQLFQLSTTEYYFEVVTYDLQQCPKPIAKCAYKFPTTGGLVRPVACGIAYDEVHDLLYISISARNTTLGGWDHLGFVADADSPCNPKCKFKLMPASRELVTGLAWDNCRRILYATDGQLTQPHYFAKKNHCTPKYAMPCKKQTSPKWHGLCLIPGSLDRRAGKPCTGKPCPSCPSMFASTYGGDPVLGNSTFGFSLTQAPSNGIALLLVRYGPLSPGFPFLCDKLYATSGPLILLSAVPMSGTGSCGGTAMVPFPLPTGPAMASILCGNPISSQWLVYCSGTGGSGFGGLSNALEFTVSN